MAPKPLEGLKKAAPDDVNEHLIDQVRAGYSPPAEGPFRCDHCEYWIDGGACKLVKGKIEAAGCCCLFEKE